MLPQGEPQTLDKKQKQQKKILKEEGLTVDGRHYSLHFTG